MQKDRKKVHKEIIKYMRRRNKEIAVDDYIGLDRFRIDLFYENWRRYDDGSGGYMYLVFKMTDKWTGNTAYFHCNNYDYARKIFEYLNDFLIRCSDGWSGSWPHLGYIAYDVHEIIPYAHRKPRDPSKYEDGVINKYNWTHWNIYDESEIL